MNQRRRARVVLAVLVLVSLVLVTVDFRTEDGPVDGLRGIATRVFGPLQSAASTVVDPVSRFVANIGDLAGTFEENQQLRDRVEVLEERRRSVEDLERENGELRALLDMAEGAGWDSVTAETISLGPSNYEWTITIDVGTDDGVAEDMAVVDGDGLVGRVVLAERSTSRVLLLIDSNFASAARLAGSGEIGDVGGRGSQLLQLDFVDPDAVVDQGDEVVTSAYRFGVFPPGIPIGVVEAPAQERSDLVRSVEVRPYVDFTSLSSVLVVRTSPQDIPADVPLQPQRDLDPPQLVPDPTPEPVPSPGDGASDGASA
jgi:rod shape-determining protein MreC